MRHRARTRGAAPRAEGGAARRLPLVGRDAERRVLSAALDRVERGEGGLAVVSGVAGTGRTRLAREVLAEARARGFQNVEGRGHVLAQERAWAAVADALEPVLRRLGRGELLSLAGDLPELGTIVGDLGLGSPEPLGDAVLERGRVLGALVRVVGRLGRRRPVVLLLDDLHAADRGTLEFLHLARRALAEARVLLLATRRTGAGNTTELDALSAPEELAGWTETLELRALDRRDVRRLLEATLGGPVAEDLLEAVAARSQGLPLLTVSLARALEEAGGVRTAEGLLTVAPGAVPLPAAVRDHVRSRLMALPPAAGRALEMLAAAGGRLEHPLLVSALAADEETLLDALGVLEHRGIVEVSGGGYAISHAVVTETLLDELSPLQRQRHHARLAEAFGRHRPDDPRAAAHLLGAGPLLAPDRVLEGVVRIGRLAGPGRGSEAAIRDLEAAVALAAARGRTDLLPALLEDLGDARELLGDVTGARSAWESALAEHVRSGEAVPAAERHRRLALLAWDDGELDRAQLHLHEAEAALSGLEPSPALGRLLHTRAIIRNRLGDPEGAARTTTRLLELAEEFGSADLTAAGHLTMFASHLARTDYLAATAAAERGRLAAAAAHDSLLLQRAHDSLALAAVAQGQLPLLRWHSRASLELAVQLGAAPLEPWPRVRLAVADLLAGDLEAALRTSTETLVMARRLGHRRSMVGTLGAQAWILASRGHLDQAGEALDEAATVGAAARPDRNIHGIVDVARTTLALARGDAEGALAVAEECLSWRHTLPLTAVATLAEAQLAVGATEAARLTAARVRRVRSCATDFPAAVAAWIEGQAAQQEGTTEAAAELLDRAATGFGNLGMVLSAARARLAWAGVAADASARPPARRASPSSRTPAQHGTPPSPAPGCGPGDAPPRGADPGAAGNRSPDGSWRSPGWWPPAGPTPRWPSGCSSAPAP